MYEKVDASREKFIDRRNHSQGRFIFDFHSIFSAKSVTILFFCFFCFILDIKFALLFLDAPSKAP